MTPPHSARTEPDADGQEGPGARKHPLTAAEKQAAELAQLMKHPEKLAPVPAPKPELPTLRPPKDIIKNVSGSSAGAGSGDFHVYKHARRREYERVHIMEMADQKSKEYQRFEAERATRQAALDEKTSKNKAKRDKRRAAQQRAKSQTEASGASGTASDQTSAPAARSEIEPAAKKRKVAPGTEAVTFVPQDSDDTA